MQTGAQPRLNVPPPRGAVLRLTTQLPWSVTLSNVDVEIADRVGPELTLGRRFVVDLRRTRDPVTPRQGPQALLTMLYRSTERPCRRGAAI